MLPLYDKERHRSRPQHTNAPWPGIAPTRPWRLSPSGSTATGATLVLAVRSGTRFTRPAGGGHILAYHKRTGTRFLIYRVTR